MDRYNFTKLVGLRTLAVNINYIINLNRLYNLLI